MSQRLHAPARVRAATASRVTTSEECDHQVGPDGSLRARKGGNVKRRLTRHILGISGIVLVSIGLLACGHAKASASSSAGSTPSVSPSPASSEDLSSVAFVDQAHGWAVGAGGTVLATSDGGKTWRAQQSGATDWLKGVSFPDSSHGWAVGDKGAILATVDGGATWTAQQSAVRDSLMAVTFDDASHGWAVAYGGKPHMITTADGGKTWRDEQLRFPYLNGVAFVDENHGWALGDFGSIFATTDDGANWRRQRLESLNWPSGTSASLARAVDSLGLSFADRSHGWVVGDWGTIQATADGGATWQVQRQGVAYGPSLNSIAFVNASDGWAVGAKGAILATTDGGADWRAQASGTSQDLNGVAFVDSLHGSAVGAHGTILTTTDGGATWNVHNLTP